MKLFGFVLLITLPLLTFAQKDSVKIHINPKVAPLIELETKVEPNELNVKIKGFRVQLFFDQNRTAVHEAKSEFQKSNKDVPTYIEYNAPNYTLKVGDFRTRLEATALQAKMVGTFPTSFVVQEQIYLPSITPVGKND